VRTTTRVFYPVEGDFLRCTSIVAPDGLSADGRVVASTLAWQRKPDVR
jgi:hypothetical protein